MCHNPFFFPSSLQLSFPLSLSVHLFVSALGQGVLLNLVIGVSHEGDEQVQQDNGATHAVKEVDERDQDLEMGGVEGQVVQVTCGREGKEVRRREREKEDGKGGEKGKGRRRGRRKGGRTVESGEEDEDRMEEGAVAVPRTGVWAGG